MMKKLVNFILIVIFLVSTGWAQEPIGKQVKQKSMRSERVKEIAKEPVSPGFLPEFYSSFNQMPSLAKSAASYTLSQLSSMNYRDMVNILVTIEWNDISDLFKWTSGAISFYSDRNRINYIISEVKTRGSQFTNSDNKGIPTLIEVLRSGFYLAFYNKYSSTNYLNSRSYHDTCIPSMLAIINNPNFRLGSNSQDKMVRALGLYIANASANVNVINALVPLLRDFNANINNYINVRAKAAAIWQVGSGLHYDLCIDYLYHNSDAKKSPFYQRINNFLEEVYKIAEHGTVRDNYEYLINNAVYWTARFSQFVNGNRPNRTLTDAIRLYGKWVMPSVEAARGIVNYFKGIDYYGRSINFSQVKAELKQQLLPNKAVFENGKIIFNYGGNVNHQKIKKLYWAQREVRAHFHRTIVGDKVLEPNNTDKVLTVVIYNNPKEYEFNRILNNLSTNNGGIYIESRGTFYTYERTPQQSIYTLEDLFRHEFTHYMQGRFIEPGLFGGSLYANDRVTWFDEGGAEFFAGSSRLNDVRTRKAMVRGIASNVNERMTLSQVLSARYADGFKFYKYAFAFVDYMYKHRLDIYLNLKNHLQRNDAAAFDRYVNSLKADAALNTAYMNHLSHLKANYNSYVDPSTSDDYLTAYPNYSNTNIVNDINRVASLAGTTFKVTDTNNFDIIRVEGHYTGTRSRGVVADWKDINSKVNGFLRSLTNLSWKGYKTYTCYFKNYKVNSSGNYEYDIVFEGLTTETGSSQNQLPVAVINGPNAGKTGQNLSFNSNGSNDPDGSIVKYTWNFGDGTTSNKQNVSHIFTTAKTYTVKLTVKDNRGAISFITKSVTISDTISSGGGYITHETENNNDFHTANGPIGKKIIVNGIFNQNDGNDYYFFNTSRAGKIDIKVKVNGTDAANWLLYKETDKNNYVAFATTGLPVLTGSYNAPAAGKYFLVVYTWKKGGNYTVELDGVIKTGKNIAPVAKANGPYITPVNKNLIFSSEGSKDRDGLIKSYSWNFGDGTSSKKANPSHTYSQIGNYKVVLTVTDNLGLKSSDTANVTVDNYIIAETEVNDESSLANGPVGNGIKVSGSFKSNVENDYYYFEITSTNIIDIEVILNGNAQANWLLYHESNLNQYVAYPKNGLKGSYKPLRTGKYYLVVYNFNGGSGVTYEMIVKGGLKKDGTNNNKLLSKVPEEFELYNAYPNPFNPETRINFSVAEKSWVKITVYNMIGEVVKELVNKPSMNPGKYNVIWDGTNQNNEKVASGIYIYNFRSKKFSKSKKVILLK